ncbi:hypothetical protein V6N13_144617 [Hibiscus sabdariffa]|uniref:Uncharacterized protein n=1 Tax=Hibiscus sabdariffa TaxID=183260 RepID=A0ABR2FLJ2_9ROSI
MAGIGEMWDISRRKTARGERKQTKRSFGVTSRGAYLSDLGLLSDLQEVLLGTYTYTIMKDLNKLVLLSWSTGKERERSDDGSISGMRQLIRLTMIHCFEADNKKCPLE